MAININIYYLIIDTYVCTYFALFAKGYKKNLRKISILILLIFKKCIYSTIEFKINEINIEKFNFTQSA